MLNRVVVCVLALMLSVSAAAEVVVAGMVKKVVGEVQIERAGQVLPVVVGAPVMEADKITTLADASVGITLQDDTLLSMGPNSTLVVKRFDFNSTTYEGKISLQMLRGMMRTVTGLIARQSPSSFELRTRSATVGVRGTDFLVEVAE